MNLTKTYTIVTRHDGTGQLVAVYPVDEAHNTPEEARKLLESAELRMATVATLIETNWETGVQTSLYSKRKAKDLDDPDAPGHVLLSLTLRQLELPTTS